MTTEIERIDLPTVVRDVGMFDRPDDREDGRRAGIGVLGEFVGVLDLRPWRADWPRPALSYITLTPAIVRVLHGSDSASPSLGVSDGPEWGLRDAADGNATDGNAAEDGSAEDPRVRDLLKGGGGSPNSAEREGGLDVDGEAGALGSDLVVGRDRTITVSREEAVGTIRASEGRAPRGLNREPRDDDEPRRRATGRRVVDGPFDRITRLGGDDWRETSPAVERLRGGVSTGRSPSTHGSGVSDGAARESVDAGRPSMVPLRGAIPTVLGGARGTLSDVQGGPGTPERGQASSRPGHRRGIRGGVEPPREANHGADRPSATRDRSQDPGLRDEPGDPRRDTAEPHDDRSDPRRIDDLVDVERLADRLDRVFERRSRIERERRGR